MKEGEKKRAGREQNFELLRIVAALAVIVIHLSANWILLDPSTGVITARRQALVGVMNTLCRFAVPCFAMLTGAFVLANEKNKDFRSFYKKSVRNIVIPTVVFSILYTVYYLGGEIARDGWSLRLIWERVEMLLRGQAAGHLWYMYMLIGVYLLVPCILMLKERIGEKNFARVAWAFLMLAMLSNWTAGGVGVKWDIGQAFEFCGYVMVGYVIRRWGAARKNNWQAILLAGAGLAVELLLAYLARGDVRRPSTDWLAINPLSPMVVLASVLIFAGFALMKIRGNYSRLAGLTFWIYLLHVFVMEILMNCGILEGWENWNPLLAIPVLTVVIFIISAAGAEISGRFLGRLRQGRRRSC